MDIDAVNALLRRIDVVLSEVPPELRFVRCSLCRAPLADTHRLERAGGSVTLWCWWDGEAGAVGVDASGDGRFAPL